MSDPAFHPSECYAPRPVRAGAVLEVVGWRLKSWGIAYEGDPTLPGDESEVAAVTELVTVALPFPAVATGRAGVGWVILHRGRGMDYLVLGWWDRENELPVRLWVREEGAEAWRPARGSESFCVWDLQVMAHERDAWVRHVLGSEPDVDAYLADVELPPA